MRTDKEKNERIVRDTSAADGVDCNVILRRLRRRTPQAP